MDQQWTASGPPRPKRVVSSSPRPAISKQRRAGPCPVSAEAGFSDDGDVPSFPMTKARPADAVPAGHMGYDLSMEKLLLHTIQSQEVFDELLSTGVFMSDPSRVEPLHADAYGWLYRQMASRPEHRR